MIEPPDHFLSKAERLASPEIAAYLHNQDIHIEDHVDPSIKADKRPFVGLISDIKRKIPWFISDFKEGFNVHCETLYLPLCTIQTW